MEPGGLAGLRVLELGGMVAAPYCTKLMGDLGADVIKVEPPGGGDAARLQGPFPGDVPDPERSALFLYLNTSKRGVTLDLTSDVGRRLFRQLVSRTDILVEDTAPGWLAGLGLAYEELVAANPRLIMVSVTPFGQDGPHAGFRTRHLNQYHAGGFTSGFYEGQDERPPACGGAFIADYDAGLTAAVACLAAVLQREVTGRGQRVDLSKQEASMCLERVDIGRAANEPGQRSTWGTIGGLLPAKDGYIVITPAADRQWSGLVDAMGNPDWAREEWCRNEQQRSENAGRIQPRIREWTAARTRAELYHELQRRGTPAGPVRSVAEVKEWVQLRERGFWHEIDHPETGTVEYPGPPYRFSTIQWRARRAPRLGEHNQEVYSGELGYSEGELERLAAEGVI